MEPTFKQFLSEVKYYQSPKQVTPLFVDDWLVFGRKHSAGEWYVTVAELWPDWLDYDKDPSDMGPKEFFRAIKEILIKNKGTSPSGWQKYRDWWMNTGDDDVSERTYQESIRELDRLERERGTLGEAQYYKNRDLEDCPECNGKGMVKISYMGEMEWDSCDECGGSGKITKLRKARLDRRFDD